MNQTFDEQQALAYDPFSGDFGDGETVLEDKIVTARKGGECNTCPDGILPGTRVRVLREKDDEGFHRYRFCNACCVAMAKDEEDEIEARIARKQSTQEVKDNDH